MHGALFLVRKTTGERLPDRGLHVGLAWWLCGIDIASLCFGIIYRLFSGKLDESEPVYYQ